MVDSDPNNVVIGNWKRQIQSDQVANCSALISNIDDDSIINPYF